MILHTDSENQLKKRSSLKVVLLSMLAGIIFAGLFSVGIYTLASPPTSAYTPGETLDPSCTPGSTNCTVATLYYSGGTDVTVADGGTGRSSWTQYLIPYADTTTSFSQIAIGTSGQVLTSNGAGSAPTFQDASGGGANTALSNLASVAINTALLLGTSDGAALGSTTKQWSDLFLAEGGVINWDAGDVTITQTNNVLAVAGTTSTSFDGTITPASSDGAALGTSSLMWSDVFLASGAVINFNNGDVTLTHAADTLTAAGGVIVANANLSVGNGATTAGVLKLLEDTDAGSNFASFQVPALSADTVYTLPADDGDSGEQLQTDGSGNLTWEAAYGSSGANTALSNLASVAINTSLISDTDNTDDLGSATIEWKDIYIDGTAYLDAIDFNGTAISSTATQLNYLSSATGTTGTTSTNIVFSTSPTLVTPVLGVASGTSLSLSTGGNLLTLTNTTDSASVQTAIIQGDRATMADNDEAYVTLRLSDDAGTQKEVARLTWVGTDVNAATSVDGRIDFGVMTAGTLADEVQLDGTALAPSTSDGNALGTSSLMWSDVFLASGAVINFNNGDVTLTHAADTLTAAGGVIVANANLSVGNGATTAGVLKLLEDTDAGSNFASFQVPALSADTVYTLPADDGDSGEQLQTDGSGNLTWESSGAGANTALSNLAGVAVNQDLNPSTTDAVALGTVSKQWADLFLAEGGVINWDNGDVTITQTNNVLAIAGTTSTTFAGAIRVGSSTGVTEDATLGVLTLAGIGNTNNEALTIDFETTADEIEFGTSTGVTLLDFKTFAITSTGLGTFGNIKDAGVTSCSGGNFLVTDVTGLVGCEASSLRYKENIHDLSFDKEKFLSLTPVTFNYKDDFRLDIDDIQLGLVAEYVEPVFPDLVVYREGQIEGIKYSHIPIYLYQIVKDQQKDITELKELIGGVQASAGDTFENSVNKSSLVSAVMNALSLLGISVRDGVVAAAHFAAESFTAKTAKLQRLEMVDRATGQAYCTWIENGEWKKEQGSCDSLDSAPADVVNTGSAAPAEVIEEPPIIPEEIQPSEPQEVPETPEVIEQPTPSEVTDVPVVIELPVELPTEPIVESPVEQVSAEPPIEPESSPPPADPEESTPDSSPSLEQGDNVTTP